ncbi:MAG: undecaprenyl-diphosphate phosphatase [Planctomycetales bacterium]
MNWVEVVILGIIQGITEFLPISSSGHLIVAQKLFETFNKIDRPNILEINILLHAGTLVVVLIYYRLQIVKLFTSDRRAFRLLLVGSIPAALAGPPVMFFAEKILTSPMITGCMFLVTGLLLIWSARGPAGDVDYVDMKYFDALLIGIFQLAAVLPGLSRCGSTIAAGLLVGLRREAAATFSFLLAIPVIGGVTLIQILKLLKNGPSGISVSLLGLGAAVAFVVGLFALWMMVKIVERGRLAWFALWLLPAGIGVIVWQMVS